MPMAPIDPTTIFLQEADDLLIQLEAALLDLESMPNNEALIDQAFRALHTIKGSGAMFGFKMVADFTHHLETAFEQVRTKKRAATPELVSLTLQSMDHIRALINNPDDIDQQHHQSLCLSLEKAIDAPHTAQGSPFESNSQSDDASDFTVWEIQFQPEPEIFSYGANPVLLLDELRRLGPNSVIPLTDQVPYLEEMDPTLSYLGWTIVLVTDRGRAAIEDVFIFASDEAGIAVTELTGEEAKSALQTHGLSVPAFGSPHDVEPATATDTLASSEVSTTEPDSAGDNDSIQATSDRPATASHRAEAHVRVPAHRLDALMDLAGELVIAEARLNQLSAQSKDMTLRNIGEDIERLTSDLRDITMTMRLTPIGTLFNRFRRVVRDLSKSLGKPVSLTLEGEETELDKTVVEALADPLVHLIRNAMDHGLETPDQRAEKGKAKEGHVHLSARHSGANVLITIRDDGRGMDAAAIRTKAIERGLLNTDDTPSDQELYAMVFHPGFSTAREISNVSGRGVGLDVVKQTVTGLRGRIDVTSTKDEGTAITLRLPLTLAIIDGLLLKVGDSHYVAPLASVEEVVDMDAQKNAATRTRSFLNIRDAIVPFIRLRDLFGTPGDAGQFQKVVIVSFGDMRVGLVVDQVIGQHQTVIKSLTRLHSHITHFSGATILGDGTVALILEIAHLVEAGQTLEEQQRGAG